MKIFVDRREGYIIIVLLRVVCGTLNIKARILQWQVVVIKVSKRNGIYGFERGCFFISEDTRVSESLAQELF